jgi:rhodanese-related sulfurtransferase
VSFLSKLFGNGQIKSALKKGAIVVDVRTGTEYDRGHVADAFNIPVDRILVSADRLREANLPIIICCNTGERSRVAVQQLKSKGIKHVYNGGNWEDVARLMKKA